ncbi:Pathogenesis-related protein 1 [Bienertia sinuspersici]
MSTRDLSSTKEVEMWVGEKPGYDIADNNCKKMCGHYTQIAWTGTRSIGCAKVRREIGNEVNIKEVDDKTVSVYSQMVVFKWLAAREGIKELGIERRRETKIWVKVNEMNGGNFCHLMVVVGIFGLWWKGGGLLQLLG